MLTYHITTVTIDAFVPKFRSIILRSNLQHNSSPQDCIRISYYLFFHKTNHFTVINKKYMCVYIYP